jgi:hypothetical protein
MRALVVYESMFGNTKAVAHAIAKGLETWAVVDVVEVNSAPTVLGEDVSLLVVGGPTHAFGLSRESTRRDAATKAAGNLVPTGEGIREWLSRIAHPTAGIAAAAFDTKISKPRLPGSAAKAAHKRMRWLRFQMAAPPQSFFVTDTAGPLVDGELDRARSWGERLGAAWASPNNAAGLGSSGA